MGQSRPSSDMPQKISAETFEKLREAWVSNGGTNITSAAAQAGVTWETAARYIHEGDGERGWEPIHDWYRTHQKAADEARGKSFAELARERTDQYGTLMDGVFNELVPRIYRLCRNCKQHEDDCKCAVGERDVPPPYDADVQDFARLGQGMWRWSGGGIFEEKVLRDYAGLLMRVTASVLRRHGLDEKVQDVIRGMASEFDAMSREGMRKSIGDGS